MTLPQALRRAELDRKQRSTRFQLRMSNGERYQFAAAAREAGVSLAKWLRSLARAELTKRRVGERDERSKRDSRAA